MSEDVTLPALGESVTEGTVTRWLKSVGDTVEVDEPLLEVSTDKVDTEIPSPIAGVLEEILVGEDETVEVGAVLARLGDGSGAASSDDSAPAAEEPAAEPEVEEAAEATSQPAAAPAAEEAPAPKEDEGYAEPAPEKETTSEAPAKQAATPAAQTAQQSASAPKPPAQPKQPSQPKQSGESAQAASSSDPRYVTPLVRKLAADAGVDLTKVQGTGVGGRIRKEDVVAYAESSKSAAPVQAVSAGTPGEPTPFEVSELRGTTAKMSRLRKVVAERAVASMNSTAQLTTVVEVDVTRIAQLRDRVKGDFHAKTGNKLSFLPFFTLAAAEALQSFPIINATVDGDSIVYPESENIAMAVDTERGLLTPVIKKASEFDIAGLAGQIADLAGRTRDNKLLPDELAGGTFTVTNTGSRGALFDTPVVFLPQSAILGTGIVAKRPAVVKTADGQESIAIRSLVFLALSYDHRIIDGADAARFLSQIKNRLEEGAFEGNLGL
ncbi:MAG: 2-oxoglutarate dehydrogenase, E2 component, dihydrolipoamide succinyltransferase [Pseudoclavibacter sp.]